MYNKKKYCVDCGTLIYLYSQHRCRSCESKRRWKIPKYRILQHKKMKTGRNFPKCLSCNKTLSRYGYKRCRRCNYKWIKKIGLLKDENNGMYIDGLSKNGYAPEFNYKLKKTIFERDNYICQKCEDKSRQGHSIYLVAHHIDYNKQNCKKINLITLCQRCNIKVNFNRDYWFAYFKYILTGGGY